MKPLRRTARKAKMTEKTKGTFLKEMELRGQIGSIINTAKVMQMLLHLKKRYFKETFLFLHV
jgi:hypothetical protein